MAIYKRPIVLVDNGQVAIIIVIMGIIGSMNRYLHLWRERSQHLKNSIYKCRNSIRNQIIQNRIVGYHAKLSK